MIENASHVRHKLLNLPRLLYPSKNSQMLGTDQSQCWPRAYTLTIGG